MPMASPLCADCQHEMPTVRSATPHFARQQLLVRKELAQPAPNQAVALLAAASFFVAHLWMRVVCLASTWRWWQLLQTVRPLKVPVNRCLVRSHDVPTPQSFPRGGKAVVGPFIPALVMAFTAPHRMALFLGPAFYRGSGCLIPGQSLDTVVSRMRIVTCKTGYIVNCKTKCKSRD
jgi:hypothetical protein